MAYIAVYRRPSKRSSNIFVKTSRNVFINIFIYRVQIFTEMASGHFWYTWKLVTTSTRGTRVPDWIFETGFTGSSV